ncbi:MAG: biopolymer transporter ExbD [Anaerolineae bacterium]|nr:biopolymer transporter ExbD [Phycisphaerae bacterium]
MPESHSTHPNVTPLIDVVMCLIIFYMLVAKIGVTSGADPSISIPVSVLGKDLKDLGNTLLLNVREVADTPFVTALVDGSQRSPQEVRIVDTVTNTRPLREVLLRLRYGADRKVGGTGLAADNDNFKVIIRGDRDMTYKSLEPVLIACMEANVKDVNFNTYKP